MELSLAERIAANIATIQQLKQQSVPHTAVPAQRGIRWITSGTPVSCELECSVCSTPGIASYALGSVVYFETQLNNGAILCKYDGKPMQRMQPKSLLIAPQPLLHGENARNSALILP